VLKAYSTRVGEGPFPTECFNSIGETLRRIGNEYGATTGRPRRCGWFDLPLAKYSIAINGVTEIALTKLDVLNSFEKIPVCTAYTISGSESAFSNNTLSEVNAVYETLDGWQSETENAKSFAELPQNARNYVVYLEDQLRCRIRYVSTGPERTQTIEK
jgi:adenylosuccinate synthase